MANHEASIDFTWGKPKPTSNKEKNYYTSFFKDDEEYFLYDNVIVYDKEQPAGHVAKIMKLWEDIATGNMMTLLRWYLKPLELPSHLRQVLCESSRELFLAFGKGKGVSNENPLDCIERKCKVLCTSKDARNKQPSEDDLRAADYIYSRMYNVDLKKLSNLEGIAKILGQDVLFNKLEWVSNEQTGHQELHSLPVDTCPSTITNATLAASQQPADVGKPDTDFTTKESRGNQGQSILLKRGSKDHKSNSPLKKTNSVSDGDKPVESRTRLQTSVKKETVHLSSSVSKASQDNVERSPLTAQQPLTRSASAKRNEQGVLKAKIEANNASETSSTGRALFADPFLQTGFLIPTRARSKPVQHHETILPLKHQDGNLAESLSHGRVLLIQNVDPSISLKDMNDLMKSTLEGCSDVQMLQRSGSLCVPTGEALLVFETEGLADAALQQCEENCLIFSGCLRPLTACKIGLPDVGKIARFPGHFPLDNFKLWKQRQEEVLRKSFESFHFSDPKSVEFEMASEWKNLHEWLASCWKQLCKVQGEETKLLVEKYKKPKLTVP